MGNSPQTQALLPHPHVLAATKDASSAPSAHGESALLGSGLVPSRDTPSVTLSMGHVLLEGHSSCSKCHAGVPCGLDECATSLCIPILSADWPPRPRPRPQADESRLGWQRAAGRGGEAQEGAPVSLADLGDRTQQADTWVERWPSLSCHEPSGPVFPALTMNAGMRPPRDSGHFPPEEICPMSRRSIMLKPGTYGHAALLRGCPT